MVYAVKLNPSKSDDKPTGPNWLQEFEDIFLKELTELPPFRESCHRTFTKIPTRSKETLQNVSP